MPDLKQLHRQRAGEVTFKARDDAYRVMADYYAGKEAAETPRWWTRGSQGKPILRDEEYVGKPQRPSVNISSQLVNHFTAMFAKVPVVRNLAAGAEPSALQLADQNTAYIRYVFNRSSLPAQQPIQAFRFSLKGDAVYGVDWNLSTGQVFVRCYDPSWCYPAFEFDDLGAVDDMLIATKVTTEWAHTHLGVRLPGEGGMFTYYQYWTKNDCVFQVDDVSLPSLTRTHNLGFCPFRWVFSRPTGDFAMSDIREIPRLQDAYNEVFLLMMDSIRKNVEMAYYATGVNADQITPVPGKAIGFSNPEARINPWPLQQPPQVAMEVMAQLLKDISSQAGISPISLEGVAPGSIVTGRAVRNQVEAIEARAATKKQEMEAAFARLGEYILRVLEAKFSDRPIAYREQLTMNRISGRDIKGWYECEATYGEAFGLPITGRVEMALQTLGRIADDRKAIVLAFPEEDAGEMTQRIQDYQLRQAVVAAKAQAQAQQAAQQATAAPGQPGGSTVGGPSGTPMPQPPSGPQPPTPDQFMTSLGKLQDALRLIESALKGAIWGIGDLAIAGVSATPMVMVQRDEDRPKVEPLLRPYHVEVVVGSPDGMPAVKIM